MPIYEYIAVDARKGCQICKRGFELRRPVARPPLSACPLCRGPVKKLVSKINTPKLAKPPSISDAKASGFTVLERRDKGVYEKL